MTSPKILIVGTGAIGSFYGGKLAQNGLSVSVVSRSDFDVVKKQGIFVKSCEGDFTFRPDQTIQQSGDYKGEPDYIIVCLKNFPHIDIPAIIKEAVYPHSGIVLLQNGIEFEEPVHQAFPDNELISGIAFICVNRLKPGVVHHLDYGRLEFGSYPKGASEKTRLLSNLFAQAGVPSKVTESIAQSRWKKLIWNAPFNPISVLGGLIDTSRVINNEFGKDLAKKVMEEIIALAEATGNPLDKELIDRNLADTLKMKPYKTSMLLDFIAKRPLETEVILGNVLRAAKRVNVPAPHIHTLYCLLKLIEENRK